MRKWTIYIVIIALVLGGGGWLFMKRQSAQSAASNQAIETAVVQRGDLSITVDAAGTLTPPTEITLAFPVAGKLTKFPLSKGRP